MRCKRYPKKYTPVLLLLCICIVGIQTSTGDSLEQELIVLMGDGLSYAQNGEYEESYAIFSQITTLYPKYPHGWFWKGTVLHELNRADEARESFVTGRKLLLVDEKNTQRPVEIPPSQLYQLDGTMEGEIQELHEIHPTIENRIEEIGTDDTTDITQSSPSASPSPSTSVSQPDTPVSTVSTPQQTTSPSPMQTIPSTSPAISPSISQSNTPLSTVSTPQQTISPSPIQSIPSTSPAISPSISQSNTPLSTVSTPQQTTFPSPMQTTPAASPAISLSSQSNTPLSTVSTPQQTTSPSPMQTTPAASPASSPTGIPPSQNQASNSESFTAPSSAEMPASPISSIDHSSQQIPASLPTSSLTPFTTVSHTAQTTIQTSSTQDIPDFTGSEGDLSTDLNMPLIHIELDHDETDTEQSEGQPIEIPISLLFLISLIIGVLVGFIFLKVM